MYNFTPEDLLQFYYNELSPEEADFMKEALQHDWTLREKLNVIKEAATRLDKSFYSPRSEVIGSIMQYAMHTTVTDKVDDFS